MAADWVASLPMYDFPGLRDAHDAFWDALAARLVTAGLAVAGHFAAGVPDVPRVLTRGAMLPQIWGSPYLLFAQGCEYPLAKAFGDRVRVVAHPIYAAAGCEGARYRSAVVVRSGATGVYAALANLRGRRCVVNELDSNSGMNLLRAAVAPLADGQPFFSSVAVSGSHLRSVEMVAADEADVAAIDCVSFAHFQRLYPSLAAGVQVLTWTASTPSLPYITAGNASDATVQILRAALADVFEDSGLAHVRERLLLRGVDLSPNAGVWRGAEPGAGSSERRLPQALLTADDAPVDVLVPRSSPLVMATNPNDLPVQYFHSRDGLRLAYREMGEGPSADTHSWLLLDSNRQLGAVRACGENCRARLPRRDA